MKVKYKISDIFDLQMGKTPPRDEQSFWNSNDYKWIAISDFDECKYIENTREYISSQAVKNTGIKIVPKNTVIMSFKLSIGKVAITKEDMYTNEAIMAFFNKGVVNIELSYLYYLLKSYKWDLLAQRAAKGKSLNKEILNNATLCFHSNIQTQKEIVAVLDKVTSLISMRKEQLEKLDILVKSKFIEMFGDPVLNPKGWEKKKLGEVLQSLTTGLNPRKFFKLNTEDAKNYYVTIRELKSGTLYFNSKTDMVNDDALKLINGRSNLEKDDVLFTGTGTIGETYIIRSKPNNWNIKEGVYSLKPIKEYITPYYIKILFAMENIKKEYSKFIVGGTVKSIPMRDLNLFIIPIPPLDLQNQFAEFVEQVEKNKENIKSSLNQLETLYSALMQEYFG